MEVILNINNLKYNNIFSNLTINIDSRKLITISGPNNCGKTTLTRIIDRKIEGPFNINFQGKDIKDYSLKDYNHKIQAVYPLETHFKGDTPQEEFDFYEFDSEKYDYIIKAFDLNKLLKKKISKLTIKETITIQIALSIIKATHLVIIDCIDKYFNKQELSELYKQFRKCIQKWDLSIVITTISLEQALLTDELYIINNGEILLSGEPKRVLEKDNIINKAGLSIPFMIDLSVKLRDYDLIDIIELNKERLIDTLWK